MPMPVMVAGIAKSVTHSPSRDRSDSRRRLSAPIAQHRSNQHDHRRARRRPHDAVTKCFDRDGIDVGRASSSRFERD